MYKGSAGNTRQWTVERAGCTSLAGAGYNDGIRVFDPGVFEDVSRHKQQAYMFGHDCVHVLGDTCRAASLTMFLARHVATKVRGGSLSHRRSGFLQGQGSEGCGLKLLSLQKVSIVAQSTGTPPE